MPIRKFKVSKVQIIGVGINQKVVVDRELVKDPEDAEAATMNAGLDWALLRTRYAIADLPEGIVEGASVYMTDSPTP